MEWVALLTGRGRRDAARRTSRRDRVLGYLLMLVVVTLAYTLIYQFLMDALEGIDREFSAAFLVVIESFTTTGYGEDANLWTTWQLRYYGALMQLTGVALVFLALPVFLAPWVEERISQTAPTSVEGLSDHVVIAGYTSRGQALVDELTSRTRPYVIVEPDRELANELYVETDLNVVHGDPELTEDLQGAGLDAARAVVADVDEEVNASIALAARSAEDVEIITFVEEPEMEVYHRYAGADEVLSPRQLIGESLAKKVTAGITPRLDGAIEIDEDFDIVELPVQAGSDIVGRTVADSGIREQTGANIVGAWFRGEFASPPPPQAHIDDQTILVVAGSEAQLSKVKDVTLSERRQFGSGHVIVAGFGEVGTTVAHEVEERETIVVDRRERPGVDVVGDITEAETLRKANVAEASTVILAVSDDTDAVFATLVLRELAPEIEVIARADATETVRKLYQAGADYVLALATVAGRMLASSILDEDVISFDQQVELVRISCGRLAGTTLAQADVRAETGVTVLAVERDGETLTDVGPDFRIEEGDALVVAGTDEDMSRFSSFVGE
ncbi:NAD-binding protein [Salinirubellus salinus]|uniref:NAD-binding protein n=1 Tax=Salinirubellus salinus TaxID=1364945 RepID=A0A9E7R645_9EURY|nr:NAD-binding protein [Salinirubellus salinus]UWM55899.1 NAD-binding protein [Salinirubellus salinus]